MTWPPVWTYLLSPAIVATIVIALFKFTGNTFIGRWLNRDLEEFKRQQQEKIEALKTEQQKELERLRHQLTSRISRIHEKEFEILPKAWLMLHEFDSAVRHALKLVFNNEVPDFDNFKPDKLESFLEEEIKAERLKPFQIKALRAAADNKQRAMLFRQYRDDWFVTDAEVKQRLFTNYLIDHRIFLSDPLQNAFEEARSVLTNALTSYTVGMTGQIDRQMVREAQRSMTIEQMNMRLARIESIIKARLRYAEAD